MRVAPIVVFIILHLSSSAEEITYNMSVWGFTFGQMVVSHTMENDSTELYTLRAEGKVNFLWIKKEGSTKYEVRFRNGKMISSNYIRTVNGETEYWNNVEYNGSRYLVESNKGNRHFTEVPEHTVLALYFNPNTNSKRVFCEAESEFSTISEIDDNRFELACTDGSTTSYYLKHNRVEKLEIQASLANVKITRVH